MEIALLSLSMFLTGLIWVVQLVHYPTFHFVSEKQFVDFTSFHAKRISNIVIPVMVAEGVLSAFMVLQDPSQLVFTLNFLMVGGIWASTFFLSVPCHKKLYDGKNGVAIDRLVRTNWVRTILWTSKSILLYCLV